LALLVSALALHQAQRQLDLQGEALVAQTDPLIVEVPFGGELPQPVSLVVGNADRPVQVTNVGEIVLPGGMFSLPIQNLGTGAARVTSVRAFWFGDVPERKLSGSAFYIAAGQQHRLLYDVAVTGVRGVYADMARVKIDYENLRGNRHWRTTLFVSTFGPGVPSTQANLRVVESTVRGVNP
jgi:hypothetical protein